MNSKIKILKIERIVRKKDTLDHDENVCSG